MSSTLMWIPDIPQKGNPLDNEIKYILGRKLCDTDGTIGYDTVVGEDFIPYLEGLQDSNVKDADKLIKAIRKYGKVILHWQH